MRLKLKISHFWLKEWSAFYKCTCNGNLSKTDFFFVLSSPHRHPLVSLFINCLELCFWWYITNYAFQYFYIFYLIKTDLQTISHENYIRHISFVISVNDLFKLYINVILVCCFLFIDLVSLNIYISYFIDCYFI